MLTGWRWSPPKNLRLSSPSSNLLLTYSADFVKPAPATARNVSLSKVRLISTTQPAGLLPSKAGYYWDSMFKASEVC